MAAAPGRSLQAPANLAARAEGQLPPRYGQADETDELIRALPLYRPVAPALVGELLAPDVPSIAIAALSGCSTSFWFTAVQGVARERCESIKDADERARCKSANDPDEEKYKKDRASTATR